MTTPTSTEQYLTRGGITVRRTIESIPVRHAVEPHTRRARPAPRRAAVVELRLSRAATRAGTWGSSTRSLVITSRGRRFRGRALNARGQILLPAIAPDASALDVVARSTKRRTALEGKVRAPAGRFTEEDRSRQPSVFSRLRALVDCSSSRTTAARLVRRLRLRPHLSVRARPASTRAPRDQRDMVLYLPDELMVVDHRREVA